MSVNQLYSTESKQAAQVDDESRHSLFWTKPEACMGRFSFVMCEDVVHTKVIRVFVPRNNSNIFWSAI